MQPTGARTLLGSVPTLVASDSKALEVSLWGDADYEVG